MQSPAVAAAGTDIVLAWTGTDRQLNVVTPLDPSGGAPQTLAATTSYSPAVCTHGEDLVMAWTGTDRHLNVARLRRSN